MAKYWFFSFFIAGWLFLHTIYTPTLVSAQIAPVASISPQPSSTPSAEPDPSVEPTPQPSATPVVTPTPEPSATPIATPIATPTVSPTPAPTKEPSSSNTPVVGQGSQNISGGINNNNSFDQLSPQATPAPFFRKNSIVKAITENIINPPGSALLRQHIGEVYSNNKLSQQATSFFLGIAAFLALIGVIIINEARLKWFFSFILLKIKKRYERKEAF